MSHPENTMKQIIDSIFQTTMNLKDLQNITLEVSQSYMDLLALLTKKGILTTSESIMLIKSMSSKSIGKRNVK